MYFFDDLERHGTQVAVTDGAGFTLSYRDLASAADRLASELGPTRTVVAVEAAMTVDTIVAYFAALRSDHVVLMLNGELRNDLREEISSRFEVATVVNGRKEAGQPGVRRRASSNGQTPSGLTLLLSTSGSTGSPKMVRLSASAVDANARAIASYLALTPGDRAITTLPLHYSYGLSVLNSHAVVGATLVLSGEPVTSRPFWNLVRDAHVTSLAGVPAQWDVMRQIRFARMDLPTIRYATQAGGRLSAETTRYLADWARTSHRRFFVMYGQTEATARISFVPPERLLDKVGSIGLPIPGGALDLVDSDGRTILAAGEQGELQYRGPNVMWGYAESAADLMRGDDLGGVLRTGDLARRDDEGFYFVVGRLKRFAKVFGNRINLDEVEQLLNRRGVRAAVSQVDDRLLIGVELADPAEVLALVCDELSIHSSGAKVVRVATIPRNEAGKVMYPILEKLVAAS